ncbi:hypothetical protein D9615_002036 [Tricholomella constricta]|uniref:Uncharacterized protein n=1 Tax=Tricholomella constricta TaxID=117010 RepID=A0A8H5M9U8_9AGAR|nr:hypothetical protein D9615_002036 [Tricholomella constricta]
MRLEIPYSVVRCIVSIHKFFYAMLSPPPLPKTETSLVAEYLFPRYSLEVALWHAHMHLNEREFGELMSGAFVRKLYFVKASSGFPREHIVAEIHNRTTVDPPQVRYLRLERYTGNSKLMDQKWREKERRQQERREQKWRQHKSDPQASADAVSEASSDSYCKHIHLAIDLVREIPGWVPKDLVYTMTFTDDDHVPSLSDLAIAASVAHGEDEHYSLLEHQCYWWADTLMAILENLVDATYCTKQVYTKERTRDNEAQSTQTRSGKISVKWVDIPIDNRSKAAHWNFVFEFFKSPVVERRVEMERIDRMRAAVRLREETERIEAEIKGIEAETEHIREETKRVEAVLERMRAETERDSVSGQD